MGFMVLFIFIKQKQYFFKDFLLYILFGKINYFFIYKNFPLLKS